MKATVKIGIEQALKFGVEAGCKVIEFAPTGWSEKEAMLLQYYVRDGGNETIMDVKGLESIDEAGLRKKVAAEVEQSEKDKERAIEEYLAMPVEEIKNIEASRSGVVRVKLLSHSNTLDSQLRREIDNDPRVVAKKEEAIKYFGSLVIPDDMSNLLNHGYDGYCHVNWEKANTICGWRKDYEKALMDKTTSMNAEIDERKKQENRAKEAKKAAGEKATRDWCLANGSELLKARIEEDFEWAGLAHIEYAKHVAGKAGLVEVEEDPDDEGERKRPSLNEIEALREARKKAPEAEWKLIWAEYKADEYGDGYRKTTLLKATVATLDGDEANLFYEV